jgi:hypothetical protein
VAIPLLWCPNRSTRLSHHPLLSTSLHSPHAIRRKRERMNCLRDKTCVNFEMECERKNMVFVNADKFALVKQMDTGSNRKRIKHI